MANVLIVGAQWGDEGKGKIVDLISEHFDLITRHQGGHNAGHTVYVGPRKFILTLVPSGIIRPGKKAVIGNGLVINPAHLLKEIETLEGLGVEIRGNLFISNRAHVIFPYHPMMEKATEATPGKVRIGTTSRGIGPCYEDKIARRGIRLADLLDTETFPERFQAVAEEKNAILKALDIYEPWDIDEVCREYLEYAERLRPFVCDTAQVVSNAVREGQRILFEGAQGAMLDIDHGTYPFVTSSNATGGGVCTGLGVSPTVVDAVIGIAKAYATRVGGGPFPSEDHGPDADALRKHGGEFGTVTGRPRRCGWFDLPLSNYVHMVNGLTSIIITKLDVLDHRETIPVCTGYRYQGETLSEMPALSRVLEAVEPVIEERPGWHCSTRGVKSYEELPQAAKDYLAYLEDKMEVEIGGISTGPEREETIIREGSKLAGLLG